MTDYSKIWINSKITEINSEQYKRNLEKVTFYDLTPGQMYIMSYSPKYKKTLPYYDVYPLFFYMKPAKGGFYGINLHYIYPQSREKLIKNMVDIMGVRKMGGQKNIEYAIKLSYNILCLFSKFALLRVSIKHYKYRKIWALKAVPSNEWGNAIKLPLAKFVSETQKVNQPIVWKDTAKKAKDGI